MDKLHELIQEHHPLIQRKINKLKETMKKHDNPMVLLFLEEIEEMEQEIYNAAFPRDEKEEHL